MYKSDLRHDQPSLADKLKHIYTLNRDRDLDLDFRPPYEQLLQKFGNPHLNLPPVIHAAGTNGKGSTLAFLRAMLEQLGLSVHVYTSPHLVKFNERIVLAGRQIDDDTLESLIDEGLTYNGDGEVSFFEFTTAIAFAAFARTPADIVLLETGLGGRLDCTNVVPKPLATVITPIGFDHQDYLGDTAALIADEKAGIMKKGVPCITAQQTYADAKTAFRRRSETVECDLISHGDAWSYQANADGGFDFVWKGQRHAYPAPSLQGTHQISNAATALAVMHTLRDQLPDFNHEQLASGLTKAHWPARLQNISHQLSNLPNHIQVWLDGGHNKDAASALIQHIQTVKESCPDMRFHVICTMMRTKDASHFLQELSQEAASITAVPLPWEAKAFQPQELQDLAGSYPLQTANDVPSILHSIYEASADTPQTLLFCGSLYLAGHVLELIQDKLL